MATLSARLNRVAVQRKRHTSGDDDRKALAAIERKLKEIVTAIEDGGYTRGLSDRLRELEARQDEITQRLSAAPAEIPDIHPNIADIYRRKVARLAEALNHPEDRHEATAALRGLIERIVLTPGPKRGRLHATLHGGLEAVLEWVARTGEAGHKNKGPTFDPRLSSSAHARANPRIRQKRIYAKDGLPGSSPA